MKNLAKRSLALLMALVMCISLLPGVSVSAATVDYVSGTPASSSYDNVIKNWGKRGTTATFMSPNAEAFYADNSVTYEELAALSGSSTVSSVPSSELYLALQELMESNHTTITSYGDTKHLYAYTDCQENGVGTTSGAYISSFYSGTLIGPAWGSSPSWNREHTWPNSKGLGGSDEDDIMMLRPTATSENSGRGNTAYGESSGYYDPNDISGGTYNLHGDVARIMLYTYVRWGNTSYMWGSSGVMESKEVLLKWMEEDPVDTWELGRNDAVESITGTRNVFVDYPELAFTLFGEAVPGGMSTPSGGTTGEYTISAVASPEAGGTVSVEGNIITAVPNEGYVTLDAVFTSGTGTVTQDGNVFTVKATSDCTLKVTFYQVEETEVVFYENGEEIDTLETMEYSQIIMPEHTGEVPEDYTFVGWVTEEVSDDTATAPATVYKPGIGCTIYDYTEFYALYTYFDNQLAADENTYFVATELSEGDYVIYSDGAAMTASVTSNRFDLTEVTLADDKIETEDTAVIWHIAPESDGTYSIYNEAAGVYAASTGVKNQGVLMENATDNAYWTIELAADYSAATMENVVNKEASVNYTLRRNGEYGFATYASSTGTAPVLYKASAGTVYYTTTAVECEHASTTETVTAATCTEPGSDVVTCDSCGRTLQNIVTPAIGHSLVCSDTSLTCENGCGYQVTFTLSPIADVKASTDSDNTFYVKGVVTFIDGTSVYMQDETGALCAYFSSTPDVQLGDEILAWGTRAVYNGLIEIKPAATDCIVISSANSVAAQTVTIEALNADYTAAATYDYMCEVVSLENVTISAVGTYNSSYGNVDYTLSDGTNTIVAYRTPVASEDDLLAVGTIVNVTGIVGVYNAYQIRVISADDVVVAGACQHEETTLSGVVAATCTTPGYTGDIVCASCGEVITAGSVVAAPGHTDEDGDQVCDTCGLSTATGSVNGLYYIAAIREEGNYFYMTSDLGTATTKRYQAVDSGLTELPEAIEAGYDDRTFHITPNTDGTYSICVYGNESGYLGWSTSNGNGGKLVAADSEDRLALTLVENEDGTVNFLFDSVSEGYDRYLALNSDAKYNYFAFYKDGQAQNLSLIPVSSTVTCAHSNTTVTGKVDATCTTDGYTGDEICDDCGCTVTYGQTVAAAHSYVDGVCSGCGATQTTGALTSGQYYISLVDTTIYLGVYSDGWVTALSEPSVWTVTVSGDSVTLQDANGVYIAPKSGNTNGITSGEYSWTLVDNGDGTYSFKGVGTDTTTLASNKASENKFRAYKNATIAGNAAGYPTAFVLTPVGGGEETCTHANTTTTTVDATCTAAGSVTVACDDCGETISTETIEATGHVNTTTTTVDATCAAAGSVTVTCDDCGETISAETIPMAEHEYFYACDQYCMNCGELTNEDAEHTVAHVEAVEATCQAMGNMEYWHCTICGAAWTDEAMTQVTNLQSVKTGYGEHTYADGVCTVCGAAEPSVVVAMIGETEYDTLGEALAAAVSGDTVELVANTTETLVYIAPGVTLDLNACTLEATYVLGLNGSYLTADDNSGKLIVAQDNIALSTNGYKLENGNYVLPVWDEDHFVFSLFAINTDTAKDRGLTVDKEAEEIYFQFKHQATGAINKSLLADGCSDNELSVIVRLTWTNEQGTASQDFVYNDGFVGEVVGGKDYTFTLTGYTALNIDLETLVVQAMIVTDSGATAFGAEWEAK